MPYERAGPSRYIALGESIRMERLRRRLSQRELGARLGVSHAAISDLENGKTKADLDRLSAIAAALGLTLEQLLSTAP